MRQPEYYLCIIGPADRTKLPMMASDTPMRAGICKAFRELTGHDAEEVFAGWGMSRKRAHEILQIWDKPDLGGVLNHE